MIQAAAFRIVNCYMHDSTISFTELCERVGYPTDLGGYYIRQLVSGGYLEKTARGQYTVTAKGKQYIARNSGVRRDSVYPRLLVAVVAQRDGKCVLIRRKRQPFIGVVEWAAGLVEGSEAAVDAANRVAQTRLGCDDSISPAFRCFFRRTDIYNDSLFDDKLFAVFDLQLDAGQLGHADLTDEVIEMEAGKLPDLPNRAKSLLDILAAKDAYAEKHYILTPEDLAGI